MKSQIDMEAILGPIPGDNPAGEDLRYDPTYDLIKEARKSDDNLDQGAWKTEIKSADWEKVQQLAVEALTSRSKDLQIAAWLTEALIHTEGFEGFAAGLSIVNGFLGTWWDQHLYPVIEEGDMDFRAAPLEFMNERLWSAVKGIALTDKSKAAAYSWLKWQESRDVGSEADTRNEYGDVDEQKKAKREDLIASGRLTPEDFDAAAAASSREYYESLAEQVNVCHNEFNKLDELVLERFGPQAAPRLSELGGAIEDCSDLIMRLLKQKGGVVPQAGAETEEGAGAEGGDEEAPEKAVTVAASVAPETSTQLDPLWKEAIQKLNSSGITEALATLLKTCYEAPSVREKNRCRLLVARLCLQAERPDLARPIIEELYALIEELQLDKWESPRWIAEVTDVLYRCLTHGQPSDEDMGRARTLFERLCRTDVTKAIAYGS